MKPSEYNILVLKVSERGELQDILHALPLHLVRCTGIKLHAEAAANNSRVAHVVLSFNRQNQVLNLPASSSENGGFYPTDIRLSEQQIAGYVKDGATATRYPYRLNIYFRCERKVG